MHTDIATAGDGTTIGTVVGDGAVAGSQRRLTGDGAGEIADEVTVAAVIETRLASGRGRIVPIAADITAHGGGGLVAGWQLAGGAGVATAHADAGAQAVDAAACVGAKGGGHPGAVGGFAAGVGRGDSATGGVDVAGRIAAVPSAASDVVAGRGVGAVARCGGAQGRGVAAIVLDGAAAGEAAVRVGGIGGVPGATTDGAGAGVFKGCAHGGTYAVGVVPTAAASLIVVFTL